VATGLRPPVPDELDVPAAGAISNAPPSRPAISSHAVGRFGCVSLFPCFLSSIASAMSAAMLAITLASLDQTAWHG